jgi:hypothetical protein
MASGDTLTKMTVQANVPTGARYATLDTIENPNDTGSTYALVLDFDPGATTEFGLFYDVMPGQYDGSSALDVVIGWSCATTEVTPGTSTVKWDVSWKSLGDDVDNVTSKAFASIQSSTHGPASEARELQYTTIPFSNAQADSIGANEYFVLRVERDSADANDLLNANDAELHFVEVKEQ